MLTILVYDDGRLSLDSDDGEAENIRVMDAFEEAEARDLYEAWMSVDADPEGGVQMMIDARDAKRALEALEGEFPNEVEDAFEELRVKGQQ